MARTQSRCKHLLIISIVLPLFVGNAVRAAGWMVVFGNKGFVNASLMGLGLIDKPLEIMFTENAVIIGIIAVNLPFMVLSLQSVIEGIDRAVEEAAFSLGAPPLTMFRRVLWPLALPGILAGTILTFILAMNAYATPFLLGGPLFKMMAPLVYNQFTQQTNWPFGGAIAFILMAVTLSPDGRRQPDHPAPRRRTLEPESRAAMADENRTRRFAVLIDADNTSPRIVAGLFEEIAKFGEASSRRIYGDFSSPRSKSLGGRAAEICDRSLPAVRLHDRQERLRHRPGDRRHGPAAQRPVRRLLPGLFGQRLHPARLPPARGRRRCLRLRRPQDARRASARPAGASSTPRTCCPRREASSARGRPPAGAVQPASAAVAILNKAIAQMETEDGWVGLGVVGQRLANIASDFDPRSYGFRKLSDLVRGTGAFEMDQQDGRAVRIRAKAGARPPGRAPGAAPRSSDSVVD